MPDEDKDDRYRADRVDAELAAMNRRLDHITEKLDKHLEWQRQTEARLAAGNTKFEHLEEDDNKLKNADRGVLAIASIVGAAIGTAAAAAMKFLIGD